MSRLSMQIKNGKNRNPVSIHFEKIGYKSLDNSIEEDSNSYNYDNSNSWTKSEDTKLFNLVYKHGINNWEVVSKEFDSSKSAVACLHRWQSINKPNVIKGPWNVEEDKKLIDWIKTNGASNWTSCSEFITGRSGKQCRERWLNALNPLLKKGSWEPEEDYIIFKLFKKLGSKWSIISNYISGRTENSIKNRFYSTLRRIAAESKTLDKKSQKRNQEDQSKIKLSLDTLMEYFGDAYNEKTKYIDSLVSDLKLSENEVLNSGILREILSMKLSTTSKMHENNTYGNGNLINQATSKINDLEYLSKKREHKEESSLVDASKTATQTPPSITQNFNNNYNVNICINQGKPMINDLEAENVKKNLNAAFSKPLQNYEIKDAKQLETTVFKDTEQEKEDYKKLSLDALASKIDSFCQMTHEIGAPLFGKELKESKKAAPKNNALAVDSDKINNLLNQLSDLENLLHMTKNELIKIDTNTVDFEYSQKIQADLQEFEMPLLSNNVIDKEFQN